MVASPGPRAGVAIVAATVTSIALWADARPRADFGEHSFSLAPTYRQPLGDGMSLGFSLPLSYREGADAEVLDFAATLEVPLEVLRPAGNQPFGLRVTGFGTVAGSAANDRTCGGISGDGGVQGSASLTLGALQATLSSRISHHQGLTLSYQALDVVPGEAQRILESGLSLTHALGEDVFLSGSLVHTRSLRDAEIDAEIADRIVPGAGLSWRRPGGFDLSLGWQADLSKHSGALGDQQVSFNLRFPF